MRRTLKALVLSCLATSPLVTASLDAAQNDLLIKALNPNKNVVLLVDGQETSLPPTSAAGDLSLALGGDLAAALDPNKRYVLYQRHCSGYVIVVEGSEDDRRCRKEAENAETGKVEACNRCLLLVGWIDRGVWRPNTTGGTSATTAEPRGGGFSINAFGFASGSWGRFNVGAPTEAVIDTRFNSTTPPYNPGYQIDVEERGSGMSLGGGVNVGLGPSWLGARVGVLREAERNTPTEDIRGERTAGGLRFQQQGSSEVTGTTIFVGPTLTLPGGVVITGGPAWTRWNVQLMQTAQLQAGCPTPCVVVRTDNLTTTTKGSDLGGFIGAEYYPGDSWFGIYAMQLWTTYRGAYDPSQPLGYPTDWRDSNFILGGVVRLGRW